MNQEYFAAKLKEFRIKMLPQYSRETLDRNVRRIEQLSRRGMDPFSVEESWVFEYCAGELEHSKKRNSLRLEMEDLKRWVEFTGQAIRIPKFTKEAEQDPWFPTTEEYREVLKTCSLNFKGRIRDWLKQTEHERKWYRTALIIRVLAEGGMRSSELVRMNLDERREQGYFIRSSKRERDRFVALSPATLEMLDRYIQQYRQNTDRKALWTSDYGRLRTAVVRSLVKEAGKAANVPQLHPHALRHYCATQLMKSGIDLRKIQIHLGHASIQSTQRYTHMLSQDVQAEIYEIYSRVREPDFFENEEAIAV